MAFGRFLRACGLGRKTQTKVVRLRLNKEKNKSQNQKEFVDFLKIKKGSVAMNTSLETTKEIPKRIALAVLSRLTMRFSAILDILGCLGLSQLAIKASRLALFFFFRTFYLLRQ
ncbi:MAG: hypothetical protein WAV64_00435 [Candidatus Moraniibacteriota bacterium]